MIVNTLVSYKDAKELSRYFYRTIDDLKHHLRSLGLELSSKKAPAESGIIAIEYVDTLGLVCRNTAWKVGLKEVQRQSLIEKVSEYSSSSPSMLYVPLKLGGVSTFAAVESGENFVTFHFKVEYLTHICHNDESLTTKLLTNLKACSGVIDCCYENYYQLQLGKAPLFEPFVVINGAIECLERQYV